MVKRHHHHAKKTGGGMASGGVSSLGKDHHHRGKTGAKGGGKPHNKAGSAMSPTTKQKGNRPIRLAASKGIRALTSKRKKISHDTLI